MKIIENKKTSSYIFSISTLVVLLFYIFNSLSINNYETLFIDEKLIVNDVYDVWLLDDAFGRYENIKNDFLKKGLTLITELSYGGDLRYGRLWSNFFSIITGPLTLINDSVLIIGIRILNILIYFFGSYLITKNSISKKYFWICLITIYALPGVSMLNMIPKPESLSLLFLGIGLYYLNEKEFYKSIFYFGIATFVKINTAIFFLYILIYIFYTIKEKKHIFILKSTLVTLTSMIIVNPILIFPPINIGALKLPNFYKIYFEWLSSQGSYGNKLSFNTELFNGWINTLSRFYFGNNNFGSIIFISLFISIIIFVIIKSFLNHNQISKIFIFSSISYFFFYIFFIERQFLWYLNLPLLLLVVGFFRNIEYIKNQKIKILSLTLLIFVSALGNISNISDFSDQKIFTANKMYGYIDINTPKDAIEQINTVHQEIEKIYHENPELKNYIVYWHPNLFYPRNYVTYNSFYYVREYWGNKDTPTDALENADIFVTYSLYENIKNVEVLNIDNLYIYYPR